MASNGLTVQAIQDEVAINLGGSNVKVELTASDYQASLKQAVRLYSQRKPARGRMTIPTSITQRQYPLTIPNLLGVVEVNLVRTMPINGLYDPFLAVGRMDMTVNGDTFGEIDQMLSYVQGAKRIINADADWMTDDSTGVLVLWLYTPWPYLCSIVYTAYYTPDNTATGVSTIPYQDTDWLVNYVTALSKIKLGIQRRKFGGIPMPDGSFSTIDGDTMVTEGQEWKGELEAELDSRRRTLPPVIG